MLIRLIWERALVSVNDAVPRSEIDGKLTNLPTFFICIIELSIGKHFGLLLNLKRECLLLISHGFTLWPELPAWTGAICPTMWWIWAFRAAVQHRTKEVNLISDFTRPWRHRWVAWGRGQCPWAQPLLHCLFSSPNYGWKGTILCLAETEKIHTTGLQRFWYDVQPALIVNNISPAALTGAPLHNMGGR